MSQARAAVQSDHVVSPPGGLTTPPASLAGGLAAPEPTERPARSLWRWAPLALVVGLVAWELSSLRATTLSVVYLNDGSVHEQMARFAAQSISAGRLPFTAWFPYIGLGSAQFLHYQSLGSVLTGLAGTVVGANVAFRWSVYLLVCCWPLAIYASARVFGLQRTAAAAAALLSSFIVSSTGVGFEHGAYLWIGGAELWTQLLGSWVLPFAWATTWRAMKDSRFIWVAAALIGLTVGLHFMCGYLAFLGVFVLGLSADGRWRDRLARAAVLFVSSVVASAWVIVPLVLESKWSAINQPLALTGYVKGYGARQELEWLFTGQLFDAKRALPVITIAVLAGAAVAIVRWRQNALGRGLLGMFVASMLLSFGSTTWGSLAYLVPAHADLYFRRFAMGSQLAGLYLAGAGIVVIWEVLRRVVANVVTWRPVRSLAVGCIAVGAIAWVSPAVAQISNYDNRDAAAIKVQRAGDKTDGALIAPLIAYIKQHGGGRTYAGLSSNWGQTFTVGLVPVYKYLESQDVDQVTYMVPTLSLMLDPETNFDEDNPVDYTLFGIRYILLPAGSGSPVPAEQVMVDGPYSLWQISSNGYVEPVQVTGSLSADRADIGSQSVDLLDELAPREDWSVKYPGLPNPPSPPGPVTIMGKVPTTGFVDSTRANLADGALSAEVTMDRAGALLFSVSYDPGWHAWVDGQPVRTEMLAPALVGIQLGPGVHHVVFRYVGFRWYPELWAVGLAGLFGAYWAGRRLSRRVILPGPAAGK
ncbi:MAG TPA: YfhO family protein [Acidimicrobiales bacterium]|nr:YfhO family protein [Acidimicrobiales bacterium]